MRLVISPVKRYYVDFQISYINIPKSYQNIISEVVNVGTDGYGQPLLWAAGLDYCMRALHLRALRGYAAARGDTYATLHAAVGPWGVLITRGLASGLPGRPFPRRR